MGAKSSAKTVKTIKSQLSNDRNYQLDFLKFVFTIIVFISHTYCFVGGNLEFHYPTGFSWVAVHFFFIISGLLMVNSFMKNVGSNDEPGKSAMQFVLYKFKGIALECYVSQLIFVVIYILFFIYKGGIGLTAWLVQCIPELMFIRTAGLDYAALNAPMWYISAMLICMLPLYYMLLKNRSFFLYVFSPLAVVLMLAYMSHLKSPFLDYQVMQGYLYGAIIRGILGICSGAVCWTINNKLREVILKKPQKIAVTFLEIVLYSVFFTVFLTPGQNYKTVFSIMLLLPIAVAITFSGKSYVANLFKLSVFKYLGQFSLAIYLNHWVARYVVKTVLPGRSYGTSVALMIGLTAVACVVYFVTIKLLKLLWNKKLKRIFSNQENIA